jgi:hypothetical protein
MKTSITYNFKVPTPLDPFFCKIVVDNHVDKILITQNMLEFWIDCVDNFWKRNAAC